MELPRLARGSDGGPCWDRSREHAFSISTLLRDVDRTSISANSAELCREIPFSYPQCHWVRKNEWEAASVGGEGRPEHKGSYKPGGSSRLAAGLLDCRSLTYTPGDAHLVSPGWGPRIGIFTKHPGESEAGLYFEKSYFGTCPEEEGVIPQYSGRSLLQREDCLGLYSACSWNTLKKSR